MMKNFDYDIEAQKVLQMIGREESNRLFSWKECELDPSFIGFLDNYKDLEESVPKDYTIIDFGCYMAFQSVYFKDHACYIGVEPNVPVKYRVNADAVHYKMTAQEFIKDTLPCLIRNGLDLQKTFVISSAVPDREVWQMIEETFPNYRIAYPGMETLQKMDGVETTMEMEDDMELSLF
jgi:hypothetical protein